MKGVCVVVVNSIPPISPTPYGSVLKTQDSVSPRLHSVSQCSSIGFLFLFPFRTNSRSWWRRRTSILLMLALALVFARVSSGVWRSFFGLGFRFRFVPDEIVIIIHFGRRRRNSRT